MFIQGTRHVGILRKAKPLPAVPGWSRWQRGRGISCSCLDLVQECGGACAALRSYLRGSGSGHRNSVHGKRYTRTPRTCPLSAGQCRVSVSPILTYSYTSCPCWAAAQTPGARTVSPHDHVHSAKAVPSCTVLGCGAHIAADSRASLPDVNFGTSTPCSLARVLFITGNSEFAASANSFSQAHRDMEFMQPFSVQPGKPCHIMTCLPLSFLRNQCIS